MSVLDGPARSVAQTLLSQFGTDVTLIEPSGGSFDPETQSVSGDAEIRHEVNGLVESYSALTARSAESEQRSVQQGDRKITVAAADSGLDGEPTTDWTAEVDGTSYEVVGIDPVRSGDQVSLWILQVRR